MSAASVAELSVAVAGHACLDVIPRIDLRSADLAESLRPGTLVNVGEAQIATGGCVANTGVALARLGVSVELMARLGDDLFGNALLEILRRAAPRSLSGVRVAHGETSSYTIVLSSPAVDRLFLHCGGTNHTFAAEDIDLDRVAGCCTLHFGYPPLMRRIYESPAELASVFRRARNLGVTTSLDMSRPEDASEAGRVDWRAWLMAVLPEVDVFAPSYDEIRGMLAHEAGVPTAEALRRTAEQLIGWGARIVVLKLGNAGLYLRTSSAARALAGLGRGAPIDPKEWSARELCVPCFGTTVVGTTGSGDATIAGLLTAIGLGLGPEAALVAAAGVGACSVEAADACSAVPPWDVVHARIAAGWPRRAERAPGFAWNREGTLGAGAVDSHR